MPNRRAYCAPSYRVRFGISNDWYRGLTDHQANIIQLNSCLYPAGTGSRIVKIPTRCAQSERYPFVESVFDHAVVQPYIHDCTLRVREGGCWTSFLLFFKRHCRLPRNQGVLRGNLLMMRTTCGGKVINMRGRDRILANWAIERYLITWLSRLHV